MSKKKGPINLSDLKKKSVKGVNPLKERNTSHVNVTNLLFPSYSSSINDEVNPHSDQISSTIKELNNNAFSNNEIFPELKKAKEDSNRKECPDEMNLSKGFYRLPRQKTLSLISEYEGNYFLIYLYISLKAWREFNPHPGTIRLSSNYLSRGLNISPATVKRSFRDLIKNSVINCFKLDFKKGNIYKVNDTLKQLPANGSEGAYFKILYSSMELMCSLKSSNFILLLFLTITAYDESKSGIIGPISTKKLANYTHLASSTIERSISYLEEKSYIKIISRNKKSGSVLFVYPIIVNEITNSRGDEFINDKKIDRFIVDKYKSSSVEKDIIKNNEINKDNRISKQVNQFLKKYSLTKIVLKKETESFLDLIKKGKDEKEVLAVANELVKEGTLRGEKCDRPFTYLCSGTYDKILQRMTGIKEFDPIRVYNSIARFNTREALPDDFAKTLTDKELEWLRVRGGRSALGLWPEDKIKKELHII